MDNILITSKSKNILAGFHYEINTEINEFYTYHVNMTLIKGDYAYIHHNSGNNNTEFLTKKNLVSKQINKVYDINIKGTGKKIKFGILFPSKNTEYECMINSIYVKKNNDIVSGNHNLIKKDVMLNIIGENNELWMIIKKYNIKQVHIAESLYFLNKNDILKTYNLKNTDNIQDNTLFLGLFNSDDLKQYEKIKGKRIIIWFNGMISKVIDTINKFDPNTVHYSYRSNTYIILNNKGIQCNKINMDKYFKDNKLDHGYYSSGNNNKILIYDGTNKNSRESYDFDTYGDIANKLHDYEYIYSSDHDYTTLRKHILECVAGIFLNKGSIYDINEINIINTMKSRNCIVIKRVDDSDNDVKWDCVNNIEQIIRYRNVFMYNKSIKKYKKILFICTDYPNWGGAATNTYELIKWYSKYSQSAEEYKRDHNRKIYGLFIHDKVVPSDNLDYYIVCDKNNISQHMDHIIEKLGGNPDLIILRNYIDASILDNFKCDKHFMIPGVFKQNMDDFWYDMPQKKMKSLINNQIIKTINQCDKCYTNSYDTQVILSNIMNIKIELLHFNYIPYYKQYTDNFYNWDKREYDIGVIVSDYTRNIKNIKMINMIFEYFPQYKKIVIGKNNNLIKGNNVVRHDLMSHDEVQKYYENIKLIINTSFYESCSNVLIEAKYKGCETMIINSKNYNISLQNIRKIVGKEIVGKEIVKCHKILIISTQYPYYGGAATLAYKMHANFLHKNIESHCLFIHNEDKCIYNPHNIKNVYISKLCNKYKNKEECNLFYRQIADKIGKPAIIIGLNYISPVIGKYMYPNSKTYYYVTGSKYITAKKITAIEYLNQNKRDIDEIDQQELLCLNICDYIIPNSDLTLNVYTKLYPEYQIKYTNIISFEALSDIYNDTNCINNGNRIYDIAVVSSRFDRDVKNIDLINGIFGDVNFKSMKKICIGIDSDKYVPKADIHFGKQDYGSTLSILSKCKVLLVTSRYESYSLTQLDGIKCGCIVVSNINVGSSNILDDYYIQENYNYGEWVNKISMILSNYSYHKNIYTPNIPNIDVEKETKYLIDFKRIRNKKNVIFMSIDKPYNGGCSTNTYNIIKEYQNDDEINPIGIFISNDNTDNNVNPKKMRDIYHVTYNKDIGGNIVNKLKEIENKCGNIDMIFIKNYKVLTCMIWLKRKINMNYKILFSPSGLRSVSGDGTIVNNNTKIIFDEGNNLYDFINNNDRELENYVYYNCECIVPNSTLTYGIINDNFNLGTKIWHPCDITYIDYKVMNAKEYSDRHYDIAFICFSWKRKVKNYVMVRKIIDELCKKKNIKNILVIGQDQIQMNYSNVQQVNNCPNEKIMEYLNDTKILCIPSLFDSSPNILKEAMMNKCRIILSKNVGMYEIFPPNNIINDINNIEEWIKKIDQCMNNNHELKYFDSSLIKNQLKTLIISYINTIDLKLSSIIHDSGIGIYKLPPSWDDIKITKIASNDIIHTCNDYNVTDIVKYDIYYKLFINNNISDSKYYHYITVNTSNKNSICVQPYKKYPYMSNLIYVWEIRSVEDLSKFIGGKYYFLRGNYYNIYSYFLENGAKSILYPATSLIYNNNMVLTTNKIVKYKYDYLLYDDINNCSLWQNMFTNSKVIHFIKPSESIFMFRNIKRTNDFIYVATETQKTKNRNLFINFIEYCEANKMNMNIINVGKMDCDTSIFKYVTIIHYNETSSDNLIELYNSTKINLIFSGRDAYPRVLSESLSCGCYNVALDTLSDGKHIYDGFFGTLLKYPNSKKIYDTKTQSVSYESNKKIFNDIYNFKNKVYEHDKISIKYKNMSSFKLNIY